MPVASSFSNARSSSQCYFCGCKKEKTSCCALGWSTHVAGTLAHPQDLLLTVNSNHDLFNKIQCSPVYRNAHSVGNFAKVRNRLFLHTE